MSQRIKAIRPYNTPFPEEEKVAHDMMSLTHQKPLYVYSAILYDYTIIGFCWALFIATQSPLSFLFSWIIIGNRQHALVLIFHEACHFLVHENRRWNDHITNILITFPLIFFSLDEFRRNHNHHHIFMNSHKDPDWVWKKDHTDWHFPKKNIQLLFVLIKVLSGKGFVDGILARIQRYKKGQRLTTKTKKIRKQKIVFWIMICIIFYQIDALKLLFLLWVIPLFTTFLCFERIRNIADHFGLPWEHDFNAARNISSNIFEKFFFFPHCSHYHLDHHLYPQVPFYNLPKLHQVLCQHKAYQEQSTNTQHITSLWQQLTKSEYYANTL